MLKKSKQAKDSSPPLELDETKSPAHADGKVGYGRHKLLLLAGLAAVAVIAALGATYLVDTQDENDSAKLDDAATVVCSDEILSEAMSNVAPQDNYKMQPTIETIKQQEGYDRDVNCLAVVTTYYVQSDDATNSRLYYDKLATIYGEDAGYSDVISGKVLTPEKLRTYVEIIEERVADSKNGDLPGVYNAIPPGE